MTKDGQMTVSDILAILFLVDKNLPVRVVCESIRYTKYVITSDEDGISIDVD